MFYEMRCDCGEEEIVVANINDGPGEIFCKKCGKKMHQDFSKRAIKIPEYMKAGSEEVSPTEIGNRMNRSRPSGKRRSAYSLGGIKG